ncbi:MAG: chromosome segregation protein SMC [Lachnospiraceae bacterium]|nr:chromosome segregation protein SMC [Lachnospiraceae bacterium]
MYLRSIEVQGFKSFAHKTTFEFHNGITAIVGPNGSGKSNVADAVRWVLGEQSAKQLRGGSMQDVIFAGTEIRRMQSFAQVSITLDNSDRALRVDYAEVTVTRRLFRSGESEYLLNGANVRLRDIQELFYDTGIGKEGYSIIGQGRIDRLISGKPEERRELFDEAAGIVKYKRRKMIALRKLEDEQANLVRVADILKEVSARVEPLRMQSEKAKVYLDYRRDLRTYDVNYFLIETGRAGDKLAEVEGKIAAAQAETAEKQEAFEKTKEEYDRIEEMLETVEKKTESLRRSAEDNRLALESVRGKLALCREQKNAQEAEMQRTQDRSRNLRGEIEKREESARKTAEDRKSAEEELRGIRKDREARELSLSILDDTLAKRAGKAEEARAEIISILNGRVGTKGRQQRYDALREQIEIRSEEIEKRRSALAEERKAAEAEKAKANASLREIASGIRSAEGTLAYAERESEECRQSEERDASLLEEKTQAYMREHSRLEALRNLTERYEGYGGAIQAVMARKPRTAGLLGVVADLISTDKKYETAIETALGGSIRNVVTDDQDTAQEMIEYLKENRLGRVTFLPYDHITVRGKIADERALTEKGVLGRGSDLVRVDEKYAKLPEYLLGRTIVVDSMENAIRIANRYHQSLYLVTLEGESLNPGGSMTGGAFRNREMLLSRRRDIEEYEKNEKRLLAEKEAVRERIAETRGRLESLRGAAEGARAKLQELQVKKSAGELTITQKDEELAKIEETGKLLLHEMEEIRRQGADITEGASDVTEELKNSMAREEELDKAVSAYMAEIEKLEEERQKKRSALEEVRLREASVSQNASFLAQTEERLEGERKAFAAELAAIGDTEGEKRDFIAEKSREIEALTQELTGLEEASASYEAAIGGFEAERADMKTRHKGFFEKRDALSAALTELDKELFRLGGQKEKLSETIDTQTEYIWTEYGLTPSEAEKEKRDDIPAYTVLKKEMAALRGKIRALGEVNVNAIEEYKETSERYTFLRTQHDDLVSSAEELRKIIAELDNSMRRQFRDKFADISKEFDRVFRDLFGGGQGSLELDEEADILEAGISIIAQPPGKKLQNMMQLSGGEKALTAIALLFAIQNLKPSPFCMLDEIEAALDEANVTRFNRYLRKLSGATQFIVITHRRGTMAAADRLYGITMQEKGVSTLVSINLVEEKLDD